VDFELYLPQGWIDDKDRRAEVGIPQDAAFKRHWEIALDLIDTAVSWGIPGGVVTSDTGYGEVGEFRLALVERNLQYALGVPRKLSVWLEEVDLSCPVHREDLPRSMRAVDVARSLPRSRWKMVSWREGSKGVMRSRFTRVRVQPAHGGRVWDKAEGMQWLIIEWPESEPEPTKYYLLNLPESVKLKELVYAAKGRWPVEQNYRELKDELGLDHFEGRSYQGWHHHVTLTMMAFDFLTWQKVRQAKKGELLRCRRPSGISSTC
jgi:SRSO17 transposase